MSYVSSRYLTLSGVLLILGVLDLGIAARLGAQTVVATVPVGNAPVALGINPVTNRIYAVNIVDSTVSVINGATNAVIATVTAGTNAEAIAVNPVTNKIYVLGQDNLTIGQVVVIDGATNGVVATVPTASDANSIVVDTATNKVFVTNQAGGGSGSLLGSVTTIDGATNSTTTTPVADPISLALDQTTNTLWIGNSGNSNTVITEIGPGTNAPVTINNGQFTTTSPFAISVNPVTDLVYVVSQTEQAGAANFLTVIDGTLNTPNVAIPLDSTQVIIEADDAIAINTQTDIIYVTDSATNAVTVVNGTTNATQTLQVGVVPAAIAVNTSTNQVYVANSAGNSVTVINGAAGSSPAAVSATIPVGATPVAIAVNPTTGVVYVANDGDDTVSVIGQGSGNPTPTPTPTPTPSGGGGGGGGGGGTGSARLINISTRASVGTGANILIPGFVVTGSGTETLLIRGDGPSLSQFGVTGVLAQPTLSVYSGSTLIASNTGWGTNSNPALISSTAAQVGAFAFAAGSADCALIASLSAGNYTVQISGLNGSTGVALAEVYEVSTTGTRLVNISTRAKVGTGGNILIPGFVISGPGTEQLLVRADGPSLAQFSVAGILAQTTLGVYSGSTVVASNTGWGTSANPALIASTAAQVGAFAFAANSGDSAQIVNLTSGAYTIQISGVNNTTGVALAEIYEVQ